MFPRLTSLNSLLVLILACITTLVSVAASIEKLPRWMAWSLIPVVPAYFLYCYGEYARRRRLAPHPTAPAPDYFRLDAYSGSPADRTAFRRADRLHVKATAWVRQSPYSLLYLTGPSGSGKSSLVSAYLIPELAEAPPAAPGADASARPFRCVSVRVLDDAVNAVREQIRQPGVVWEIPPAAGADAPLRELLEQAAGRLKKQRARLLLVLDQFEEIFGLPPGDESRLTVAELLQSVERDPVDGLTVLLVTRTDDYTEALKDLGLPELVGGQNWFNVTPFTTPDAEAFLEAGSVPREDARALVAYAGTFEEIRGLVRPITLNMLGLVYMRDPSVGRSLARRRLVGEGLLHDYLYTRLLAGDLRARAPKLIHCMVKDSGARKPPKTLDELASETGYTPQAVKQLLDRLYLEGIVRRTAGGRWEISHEFLARLLRGIIDRIERSVRYALLRLARPALVVAGLAGVAVIAVLVAALLRGDDQSEFLREASIDEQGDRHVVSFRRPPTAAAVRHLLRQKIGPEIEVSFSGARPLVTDADLAALGDYASATSLDLSDNRVEGPGLRHLAGMKALRSLKLFQNRLDDRAFDQFPRLPSLAELDVTGNQLTGAGLGRLSGLPRLSTLDLERNRVSDEGLEGIGSLASLKVLALRSNKVRGTGLAHLRGLNLLYELDLSNNVIAGPGLEHLAGLSGLRVLKLNGNTIGDAGPGRPVAARGLERLELSGNRITGAGLRHLSSLASLNSLFMDGNEIRGDALRELSKLRLLTKLSLANNRIEDNDVLYFGEMPSLEELDLSDNAICGPGLARVASLQSLVKLNLRGNKITGAGLEQLAKLPRLSTLNVHDNPIESPGVLQWLKKQKPGIKILPPSGINLGGE